MPKFDYKAIDSVGKVHQGSKNGSSKEEVIKSISSEGLAVIYIKENKRFKFFKKKSKRIWLLNFTEYLANLLNSQVDLVRALYIIAESMEDSSQQDIVYKLINKIKSGDSFSDALKIYPEYFDNLYITLVKVGEEGGNLAFTMNKIFEHLSERNETRNFLISATMYPLILISTSLLSVLVLMIYVLPKFGAIFEDLQQPLPAYTKFMISFGSFLKSNGIYILIACILLVIIIKKNEKLKSKFTNNLHRIPFIGDLIFMINLKNLFQALNVLLLGGHPFLYSLSLAQQVITLPKIKFSLGRIYKNIKQGKSFSEMLKSEGIYPNDLVSLVSISEETGKSAEFFGKIAEQLNKKIRNKVSKLLSVIEPLSIILMGLLIGSIVLSMLSAIFGINDVQF
jgi:general secretion pathway protein F